MAVKTFTLDGKKQKYEKPAAKAAKKARKAAPPAVIGSCDLGRDDGKLTITGGVLAEVEVGAGSVRMFRPGVSKADLRDALASGVSSWPDCVRASLPD